MSGHNKQNELDEEEKDKKKKYVRSYGNFEALVGSVKDSQKVVEMLTPSFEGLVGATQTLQESLQPTIEALLDYLITSHL